MGLFDGPASVTATAPAQRNSPGQPPAAPPPDTDPIYQAAVQTAIEAERRARGEQSRQHDLINASLQPALDALADQAKQARNTTMSNMEGRGMLRSGETDTRLTGIEQTRLGGENSARTGIANRISDLDAGTQDQLAQIASGKSQAWADAVSRQQQRQQALDDQWNQYVQQLAMQRQQQAWQSQQAELQRQEQERQFQAQLDAAAAAAAAGGGGGGGGGGRRGGGAAVVAAVVRRTAAASPTSAVSSGPGPRRVSTSTSCPSWRSCSAAAPWTRTPATSPAGSPPRRASRASADNRTSGRRKRWLRSTRRSPSTTR
jgi:hypothetical protein